MKGHIEQIYNAVSLDSMGVKVLKRFSLKQLDEIKSWLNYPKRIKINFENDSGKLIDQIAIDFIKMKLDQDLIAKTI